MTKQDVLRLHPELTDEEAQELADAVNRQLERKQEALRREVRLAILERPASAMGLLGLAI